MKHQIILVHSYPSFHSDTEHRYLILDMVNNAHLDVDYHLDRWYNIP